MNKEEAKMWLSAWIPGQESDADPQMREALRMAGEDSDLAAWLESRLGMDAAMNKALADVPVPDDLEASLLETIRDSTKQRGYNPRRFSRLMALAAVLLLGLGSVFIVSRHESLVQGIQNTLSGTSPDSFENFRDGMAYYIRNVYFTLDHRSEELPSIEAWIRDQKAPGFGQLPGQLADLVPVGCKQLQWKDLPVTLVCFHTANGKIVHLFILDRQQTPPDRYLDIQKVATSSDLETAGWVTDAAVYLLVGSDPEVDVEFALG